MGRLVLIMYILSDLIAHDALVILKICRPTFRIKQKVKVDNSKNVAHMLVVNTRIDPSLL